MDIKLTGLQDATRTFGYVLQQWQKDVRQNLLQAAKRIAIRWKDECRKRMPVDKGTARQRVLSNTYQEGGYEITTEVGTNLEYPYYLEFGTKYIAGGKVLAIGQGVHVTDTDAVHSWPAKDGDAIDQTSRSIDTIGGARGRLRNRLGQFLKGSPQEQMPWLRPSYWSIEPWIRRQIDDALPIKRAGA